MKLFKKKTLKDILELDEQELIKELYKYLDKKADYGQKIERLEENEKILYLTLDFEEDLIQGGLEQYLCNDQAEYLDDLIEAFNMLNRNDISDVLNEVKNMFPQEYPSNQYERCKVLELLLNEVNLNDLNNQINLELKLNYLEFINNKFK